MYFLKDQNISIMFSFRFRNLVLRRAAIFAAGIWNSNIRMLSLVPSLQFGHRHYLNHEENCYIVSLNWSDQQHLTCFYGIFYRCCLYVKIQKDVNLCDKDILKRLSFIYLFIYLFTFFFEICKKKEFYQIQILFCCLFWCNIYENAYTLFLHKNQ